MRTLPRSASLLLLLAGCSETSTDEPVGVRDEPTVIRIATQSPLTGGQSGIGLPIKQGAELGLQELGDGLKTLGYRVELAPYDDQATPAVGVANADTIIADPTILCGVGHYNSGVFIPSSEKYHAAGLAFVSPGATNPTVTTRGYLEVSRIVGRDDVQGPAAEEYAFTTLGARSAFVIHDTSVAGLGVAEYFRTAADEDRMAIVGFEGTTEAADFSALITKLFDVDADVVFFGGIYNQAAVFFKQAREAGYTGTFLGTDGFDASGLVAIGGPALAAEGGMAFTSIVAPAESYPGSADFIAAYETAFGNAPETFAAQGYDAMGICLTGIEAAATAAGRLPTRSEVATAIRALTYTGLTGTLNFDANGDLPRAPYFIVKVNATTEAEWLAGANETVASFELAPPASGSGE